MKKLIHFVLVIALLSATQITFAAGRSKHVKPMDPAPQDTSTVRANFLGGAHPNIGGEVILVIQVLDFALKPIQGARVSAKCTGADDMFTNAQGKATFNMGTVCTCTNDPVIVTTTAGCYQSINVNCGTYTVNCTH